MVDRFRSRRGHPGGLRSRVLRAVAILAASALSACALVEEALAPPQPEPAEATEAEAVPAVEPPLPKAPRPRPARVARLPAPSEQAQPKAPEPPQEMQPEPGPEREIKLLGMSRSEATTLLGTPAAERDAAPAKIWTYAGAECAVELYFYLDVARNDFYALHYYVHGANGAIVGEAADRCLQRIYSEKPK